MLWSWFPNILEGLGKVNWSPDYFDFFIEDGWAHDILCATVWGFLQMGNRGRGVWFLLEQSFSIWT